MPDQSQPILYSFRRCPYAVRARMAIYASGQPCELREVVLSNKPEELVAASPKATVPVLIDTDQTVIDESLDIMCWALAKHDPHNWTSPPNSDLTEMLEVIGTMDSGFKGHLDRYKYPSRFNDDNDGESVDPLHHRAQGAVMLHDIEHRLEGTPYLFGAGWSLADVAVAPFVRQFANVDPEWFATQDLPRVQAWLNGILTSDIFMACMTKYPAWQSGTPGEIFPA